MDPRLGRFHLRQPAACNEKSFNGTIHTLGDTHIHTCSQAVGHSGLSGTTVCSRFNCQSVLSAGRLGAIFSCRQQLQHFPTAIKKGPAANLCAGQSYSQHHLSSSVAIRAALWLFLFQFLNTMCNRVLYYGTWANSGKNKILNTLQNKLHFVQYFYLF